MKRYSEFPWRSRTRTSNIRFSLVSYLGHSLWRGRGLNPLQGCSWCILQPQPTGLGWFNVILRTRVVVCRGWGSYSSAESQPTGLFVWRMFYSLLCDAARSWYSLMRFLFNVSRSVCSSCSSRFVWFVGFYGISTFVGYLALNPFLCK